MVLDGKEVMIAQRLIPENGDLSQINWDWEKFDEQLVLINPEIRGITLYWKKSISENERSFTPAKLVLEQLQDQLYIYPQSQPQVVIRVGFPKLDYTRVSLKSPDLLMTESQGQKILLMRDRAQQLAIELPLTSATLQKLKELL